MSFEADPRWARLLADQSNTFCAARRAWESAAQRSADVLAACAMLAQGRADVLLRGRLKRAVPIGDLVEMYALAREYALRLAALGDAHGGGGGDGVEAAAAVGRQGSSSATLTSPRRSSTAGRAMARCAVPPSPLRSTVLCAASQHFAKVHTHQRQALRETMRNEMWSPVDAVPPEFQVSVPGQFGEGERDWMN